MFSKCVPEWKIVWEYPLCSAVIICIIKSIWWILHLLEFSTIIANCYRCVIFEVCSGVKNQKFLMGDWGQLNYRRSLLFIAVTPHLYEYMYDLPTYSYLCGLEKSKLLFAICEGTSPFRNRKKVPKDDFLKSILYICYNKEHMILKERGGGQNFSISFWMWFSQPPLCRYRFKFIFDDIIFLLSGNIIEYILNQKRKYPLSSYSHNFPSTLSKLIK